MILGGVGLGICSACRAPGAFWYRPVYLPWVGAWMCDSCADPHWSQLRIIKHLNRIRGGTDAVT
jgi:hypothetical protein